MLGILAYALKPQNIAGCIPIFVRAQPALQLL